VSSNEKTGPETLENKEPKMRYQYLPGGVAKKKTIKNPFVLKAQFWNHARDSCHRHRIEGPFLTRMTIFSNEDHRNDEKR